MPQSGALILIMAIAVLAPLPAYAIGRRLPVPLVIFEILLGILVGPDVLGWAGDGQVIDTLSGWSKGVHIGTARTSTALGTVLPVLRDAGGLHSRFGSVMPAVGAVGEFGPIIAMALLLSGRARGRSTAVLAVFALLVALKLRGTGRGGGRGHRGGVVVRGRGSRFRPCPVPR